MTTHDQDSQLFEDVDDGERSHRDDAPADAYGASVDEGVEASRERNPDRHHP